MSGLFKKNSVLLAKIQPDNNDASPTGSVNAMLISDLTFTPIKTSTEKRNVMRGFAGGADIEQLGQLLGELSFNVEIAGSGAAGTAPAWSPLHQACGLTEDTSVSGKVLFTPTPIGQSKMVTIYYHMGGMLFKFLNARGELGWDISMGKKPVWKYTFTGLRQPVIDNAVPTADFSAFKKALLATKQNTPTFTIHGYAAYLNSFSGQLGNDVVPIDLVGREDTEIQDRLVTNKFEIEAVKTATKDFLGAVTAETLGAVAFAHGTTPGNIVKIDEAAVQLLNPAYSGDKKIMLGMDGNVVATAANNDITITVQ